MGTLLQRGHTWFLRVNVPKAKQEAFGKKEVVRTLGTRDVDQAKRKAPAIEAEILNQIDAVCRSAGDTSKLAEINKTLAKFGYRLKDGATLADASELLPALLTLQNDALAKMHGETASHRDPAALAAALDVKNSLLVGDPAWMNRTGVYRIGGKEYKVEVEHAVPFDGTGLGSALIGTLQKKYASLDLRKAATVTDLVDQYCKAKTDIQNKTREQTRFAAKMFSELIGDMAAAEITPDLARRFRDLRARVPKRPKSDVPVSLQLDIAPVCSPKTVKRDVNCLGATFAWALRDGLVSQNPFTGIQFHLSKRSSAKKFTREEVAALIAYLCSHPPKNQRQQMGYRLIVLGSITGARLDELAQLRKRHIRRDGGRTYLDLTSDMELKTEGSVRRVPIHKDAHTWFNALVLSVEGDELFPGLKVDADGKKGNAASKLCSPIIKRAIPDGTFHALRHFMKDAFREADVPRDIANAIQGHVDGSVSGSYGHGYSLNRLADEMNKVDLAFTAPFFALPEGRPLLDHRKPRPSR